MITLFLMLVLAGFAAFMVAVGTVWARNYVDDMRACRAAASQANRSPGDSGESRLDRRAA